MNEDLKQLFVNVYTLFKRYGIRSLTMDDISRELGISKKTLYEHVKNKEELVDLAFETGFLECINNFEAVDKKEKNAMEEQFEVHQNLIKMMKDYNPATDYDLKKYYPHLHKKHKDKHIQFIYQSAYENLKKGKKEGLYRKDIDEEVIANMVILRYDYMTESKYFASKISSGPAVFFKIFEYHLRGIASEKGLAMLTQYINKNKF